MAEWQEVKLGDVSYNASETFDLSKFEEVVFVNTGDVLEGKFLHKNYSSTRVLPGQAKKIIRSNDILFSEIRPANKRYAFVDFDTREYVVSTKFMILRTKGDILPKYLYLLLINDLALGEFQRIAESRSGTFPQITFDAISYMPISLPPKNEQSAILDVIGTLSGKIELNKSMNETLEAMARALFKSWFVDFDPVRAKMEGRIPDGLTPDLAALFPDTMVNSPLGSIPEGWRHGDLGDFVDLNSEAWTVRKHPENLEYIDLANTKWGNVEASQRYTWSDAPSRARRVTKPGDTIVGTVRPGNGSYSYISRSGYTVSTGFAVLRPKKGYDKELVFLAATAPENIDRLAHLADGGAYPAIKPEVVLATATLLAHDEIHKAFSEILRPAFEIIEHNKNANTVLSEMRDSLLPKLISGDLRVANIEPALMEAV